MNSLSENAAELLSNFEPASSEKMQNILAKTPSLPEDYYQFIKEVGSGNMVYDGDDHFSFESVPIDAAKELFQDEVIYDSKIPYDGPAKGTVWVFGFDSGGASVGFDSGDENRLVEIAADRTIIKFDRNMTFKRFIEGLIVCYPQTGYKYENGIWYGWKGEEEGRYPQDLA